MKLTDEIKQKMDSYFDNLSVERFFKDLEKANPTKQSNIKMIGHHTLQMWHDSSFSNKTKISLMQPDDKVSCFYCCKTYLVSDIVEYTGIRGEDKGTALCPYCSIDSVCLLELDKEDLKIMSSYYFGEN